MGVYPITFEVTIHILIFVYISQTVKCESKEKLCMLEIIFIESKMREVRWQTEKINLRK